MQVAKQEQTKLKSSRGKEILKIRMEIHKGGESSRKK
jgi:hypothetical protein